MEEWKSYTVFFHRTRGENGIEWDTREALERCSPRMDLVNLVVPNLRRYLTWTLQTYITVSPSTLPEKVRLDP